MLEGEFIYHVNLRDDTIYKTTFKMNFEEILDGRLGLIPDFCLNPSFVLCAGLRVHTRALGDSGEMLRAARRELERHAPGPVQLIPVCAGLPGGWGESISPAVLGQRKMGVFSSLFWVMFNNFYSRGFCALFSTRRGD